MSRLNSIFVIFVTVFSLWAFSAHAQESDLLKLKKGQPITVDGDKVEYFDKENKITAEGNVTITYADVKLSCDKIELNTKEQKAICQGHVKIENPEGVLTGDYIVYDLLQKKGEIVGAEVMAFPWFGKAEDTQRVSENEYLLKKGYVTTCDLDEPHYRIQAEEIKVFPGEKIMAKNAVVYAGNIPVLWMPYYYQPIIESRAKVQFIPGQSSDWGYFLLSATRIQLAGNTKVDVLADYRTKKGFAEGANLYYDMADFEMPGLGAGIFRAYYIEQNDIGTYDPTAFRDEGTKPELRDRYNWRHRIDFDSRTVGMLEFNKVSDEDVLKDYFYNEFEENAPIPPNYASIITAQPNYTFELNVQKRYNNCYTVIEKVPELKLDIPSQRLWDTMFYYKSETSGTVFDKEFAFEQLGPQKVARVDSYHRISHVSRVGFLNVTPYGEFRESMYSRTKWEDQFVNRETLGAGVNVFSRFHKIYKVDSDPFGIEINDLRHLIMPQAEYFYTHQPNVDKDNLFQMDQIDSLEKQNGVKLSIENKLQTKRDVSGKLVTVDLVRSIISTDYHFRMKKHERGFVDGGQFRNLLFDTEFNPYHWLYVDTELEVATKNEAVRRGSVEFAMQPKEYFRTSLGYRYEKDPIEPRNQLTFDMSFIMNSKWRLGLYERFDAQRGTIEEQQISVTRDLHCWEVELTYDVRGSNFLEDEHILWIAFKIKAFPDLPIGLNRSYTKDPAGSRYR